MVGWVVGSGGMYCCHKTFRPLAKPGPDGTGRDRSGADRIGSDRIDKTQTGSITPENMLEFCAFLSCVVVSSFIKTRQNVFSQRFQSGIMKDTM